MKHIKRYFHHSNNLLIKESFILEDVEAERTVNELPGLKVLGNIPLDDLERRKRKRIEQPQTIINKEVSNPIIKKHNSINYNCKFDVYFKEEHVADRMRERNISESEIIDIIKKAVKDMVYFSFKYKFNILKTIRDENNVNNNSFMIRYNHNNGDDISIPVNVVCKDVDKKDEFDIIVHTVLNYDLPKMWDGQYVVNVHDDDQSELYMKKNGRLISVE